MSKSGDDTTKWCTILYSALVNGAPYIHRTIISRISTWLKHGLKKCILDSLSVLCDSTEVEAKPDAPRAGTTRKKDAAAGKPDGFQRPRRALDPRLQVLTQVILAHHYLIHLNIAHHYMVHHCILHQSMIHHYI